MSAERSRFDFAFIPSWHYRETVDFIRLGEELNYRCAWLPDQTFHRDPFVLLGLCAQATSEIGLGLGLTSPYTRYPAQIARGAGTLDEVSNQRFRLGLGTANPNTVLAPMGLKLERPIGRLRDSIKIIRRLLAGESVDFDGENDQLKGLKLDFSPPRAELPIYIGTRGPQMLQLAGELGDGVLVESLFNSGGLPHVYECLEAGAARTGRSVADVDVVAWQLVQVTDDAPAAIAALKPWVSYSLRVGPPEAMLRVGVDEDVLNSVNDAWANNDSAAAAARVTDDTVRCLMIIGTPEQVTRQVGDVFDKGVDALNLLLLGAQDAMRTTLVRFAKEVMPAFR